MTDKRMTDSKEAAEKTTDLLLSLFKRMTDEAEKNAPSLNKKETQAYQTLTLLFKADPVFRSYMAQLTFLFCAARLNDGITLDILFGAIDMIAQSQEGVS